MATHIYPWPRPPEPKEAGWLMEVMTGEGRMILDRGNERYEALVLATSIRQHCSAMGMPEVEITLRAHANFKSTYKKTEPARTTIRESYVIHPRPWWAFWRRRGGKKVAA